jgi:GT2 family glycosyltransferase
MSHTAVVILNYNGETLLPRFLPSVIRHSEGAAVIVADNGSVDRSVEILKNDFPSVTLIRFDQNYGFCGGYNKALKEVEADYYVLLNSDVEVTPGWLAPLQQLLDHDSTIGAVQPKILAYSDKQSFEYAGAGGGLIDSLGYPFCRGRILNTVEQDHAQYDDETQIFWSTGACMMIRSRLYHQFNGLDDDFFAHMEEIDLCWKLQRNGSKVYYSGKSRVYHLGAGTLGYANPKKTYLNFRNGLSLIYKHFDPGELWYKLPMRILLDWAAALMFLFRGEGPHANAVFRAHKDFGKNFRQNNKKRKELREQFPSYSRKAIYPGFILLNYFLGGKKTWSDESLNNPR